MKYIQVMFINGIQGRADKYDYLNNDTLNLEIGSVVLVPTRAGLSLGQVVGLSDETVLSHEPSQVLDDLTLASPVFEEYVKNVKIAYLEAQLEYEVEQAELRAKEQERRNALLEMAKDSPAISTIIKELDKLK